jgi:hypothetical protein
MAISANESAIKSPEKLLNLKSIIDPFTNNWQGLLKYCKKSGSFFGKVKNI